MTRLIITLLVGSQLGAFAGPAACVHDAADGPPVCERSGQLAASDVLQEPLDCEACGMAGCHSMLTCTAIAPAVPHAPATAPIPAIVACASHPTGACARIVRPSPPPPPPRA